MFDQRGWSGTRAAGSLEHFPRAGADIVWVDSPYEFDATLKIDSLSRGRSSAYVTMTDWRGREYPMSIAELIRHVKSGKCQPGGIIEGRFTVVKRGQNYLIEVA